MSLVNQMLRDLQERSAADHKPLAGLHAVAARGRTESAKAKFGWLTAVFVASIAIVMTLWWRTTDGTGNDSLQAGLAVVAVPVEALDPLQPDVKNTHSPVIDEHNTPFVNLRTNRLDYELRSPPRPISPQPRSVEPEPVAVSKPRKTDAPQESNEAVADDPRVAVRQAVAPAVRLRREGLAALRAGRAAVAGQLFTQLVSADPVNPEAHLLLHAALKAQSRDAEAQDALLDGLNTSSDSAQLAKVLAHEMLAAGRVENARALLTTHRPDGAQDLDYEALLAAVNQRAGNHAAAAGLYEQLVARQPANGDWWVGLAISQEAQGLVDKATKSFATASSAGTLDARLARYAAQRLERLEQGS